MSDDFTAGVEFGDKVKVEVKDLDALIAVLNKFEAHLSNLIGDLTLMELGIGFVITCFAAGVAFTLGRRIVEFITWIPVGFISLFRESDK